MILGLADLGVRAIAAATFPFGICVAPVWARSANMKKQDEKLPIDVVLGFVKKKESSDDIHNQESD